MTPSDDDAVRSARPAELTVVSPEGREMRRLVLAGDSVRVGREADNDVVLDPDPGQFVSRQHCVIEPMGCHWHVQELSVAQEKPS